MKNICSTILLFFITLNYAVAFDGQRQGFVLGLGLGAGFVNPQGTGKKENISSPFLSGTLAYGFNDHFQLGVGKKIVSFKYNNKTVHQELGGIIADFFINDYYLTLGTGVSSATNKVSLSNILFGNASFVGLGHELTPGLNAEFVIGNATFDTAGTSVVTPEKETFFGVLLTTFFY